MPPVAAAARRLAPRFPKFAITRPPRHRSAIRDQKGRRKPMIAVPLFGRRSQRLRRACCASFGFGAAKIGHNRPRTETGPNAWLIAVLNAPEVAMRLSRRSLLHSGVLAAATPVLARVGLPALAQDAAPGAPPWRHGLALLDEPRYAEGFKHFDYVNPSAPKGGAIRMFGGLTFDNFNPVVGAVRGALAAGTRLSIETLFTSAFDEVSSMYGLLAEVVAHPEDFSSVIYRLRPQARWHDGKPVSTDDVIFSFEAGKKYNPRLGAYYRHVMKAEQTGEHEVTFRFDGPGNRELPLIVGEM